MTTTEAPSRVPKNWRQWDAGAKMRLRWRLRTDWAGPPHNDFTPRPNQITPEAHVLCSVPRKRCLELLDEARTLPLDPIARLDWLAEHGHVDWLVWLLQSGRGFGKTRVGAEDIAQYCREWPGSRIGLIARTLDDVRLTMVEGDSGLLSVLHHTELRGGNEDDAWNRTIVELWLANGCYIKGFTSEKPNKLRGPQHHRLWCDEFAAWMNLQETWDMAMFGLRLTHEPVKQRDGTMLYAPPPQAIVTTTPKPKRTLIDINNAPGTVLTRGSTYDNIDNLAPERVRELKRKHEGTQMGRAELHGELIEEAEGALWSRKMIDDDRVLDNLRGEERYAYVRRMLLDDFRRVVVAVDPAVTANEDSDETGIIVAGMFGFRCPLCERTVAHNDERHGAVFGDESGRFKPLVWANKAIYVYQHFFGDVVVAERNNGGDMVESTLRAVDGSVSYRDVWAKKGKILRAQPVSALYGKHRIHHIGVLPELEDQQCTYDPDEDEDSPDRLDALVYALTELFIGFDTVETGRQDRKTDDR